MSTVQLLLHFICIIMFLISAFSHGIAIVGTYHSRFNSHIRRAMFGSSVFGAGLSILFIALQAEWVFSGHNEAVGNMISYAWLVFDYLLAIFLLSTSMVIRSMLEWQVSASGRHERWYERELSDNEELGWFSSLDHDR